MNEAISVTKPLVMVVITRSDIGGAQKHVLQLLQHLQHSYRLMLVSGERGFLTNAAEELDLEVCIVPLLQRPIQPVADLRACFQIIRLIRKYRPAMVHAHSFKAGVVARVASLLCGVPSIFTAHGWSFTPGAPLLQRIVGFAVESVLCRTGCLVVTVSRHDFFLARRWKVGPDNRRYLIQNAGNPPSLPADPSRCPVRILSIGRATPVKNQQLLIHAVQKLPRSVDLTIVGGGPLHEKLIALVDDLQLGERVSLPGEVKDVAAYFKRSQIFALSSNFEGLPLSILEAMSVGLPVVSTDVGGVNEAVKEGETGFLVPRGDSAAMASRLNTLVRDPALRQSMGDAGRSLHTETFTVDRFIDEMQQVYHETLGSER